MAFDSLHALWWMDGQGGYVWAAWGVSMLLLLLLIVGLRRQRQRVVQHMKKTELRSSHYR